MKTGMMIGLLAGCLLLGGCIRLYQPDIQQGNVVTPAMRSQLHLGMSKDQVVGALGNPVLTNLFNDNHWPYVYTYQHSGGKITKKQLDLYFQNDRLVRIDGNYS